jgi:UDP-glucose 4-epimerase
MDAQSSSRGRRRSPSPWVYVDDVVDAFITASSKDDLASASLDIGAGELVTIRAIVERIVETVGTGVEPDYGALPERPLEIVRAADLERTKTSSAGSPERRSPRGCSTVDWYRAELERDGLSVLDPPGR